MQVEPKAMPVSILTTAKPTRGRIFLAVILFITLLVAYLDRVNVSVLMADPGFLNDMGITGQTVQMGLLMTVFLAAYGVSNIVTGGIGDRLGPRKAMALSILLWAIAVSVGGLAQFFAVMLMARVILGIGEGMHWPMQSAFVKNWFPPDERGKANSAWILGLMVGPAIAMPLFTAIVTEWGWRSSFFTLGALGLVPLTLIWFCTTDHPRMSKWVNTMELEHIESGLQNEARQAPPAQCLRECLKEIISNYRFWLLTLGYFSIACIWWGMMAWLPSYLKVARGFSWAQMGALSSLPYILGGLSVVMFGHLSDRLGRRAPFLAASLLGSASLIYISTLVSDNMASALLISCGIAFIGAGLPASWSLLQHIVPPNAIGAGAGMMNGFSNGGSAFSPVLIGLFISMTNSYTGGLLFLVGIGVLGGLGALILAYQRY